MLDAIYICGAAHRPFLSPVVTAQIASEGWQLAAYWELRRRIFADEQKLFVGTDEDEHDRRATPIVAIGQSAGMLDQVIGVVRIYPTREGVWFGGRLGVERAYRSRGVVGTALICAAVSTAHAFGCRRFLATIQEQNVAYFEQHRFFGLEPLEVCGTRHLLMEADLDAYPAEVADASAPVDGATARGRFQRARAA